MSHSLTLSPLRLLRRWLAGERRVAGPGAIHLDVAERLLDCETAALTYAHTEAGQVADRVTGVRELFQAALTDPRTPGIVDRDEARGITRALATASQTATTHTQTLANLL